MFATYFSQFLDLLVGFDDNHSGIMS